MIVQPLSKDTLQAAIDYFSDAPIVNYQPRLVLVLRRHVEELDDHYGVGEYSTAQAEYHAYLGGWLEDEDSQHKLGMVFGDML